MVEVQLGLWSQEAGKRNVLSHKIDMKSIALQLVTSLLTAVNGRHIFADDRHVDDYVTSFIHVFNNAIQQSIFKGLYIIVNRRESFTQAYTTTFSKKTSSLKKILDQDSLANHRAMCREAKLALCNYVSCREQKLLKCHNQSAFYKYINRAFSNRALSVKLTDSFGNIVSPGIDNADIFNMEFAGNFSPIEAPRISHDSSKHQFNIALPDTYSALCAAPSSSLDPDGVPEELFRRLAAALALLFSIVFQQSVIQECFSSSWKEVIVVPIYKGNDPKNKASL